MPLRAQKGNYLAIYHYMYISAQIMLWKAVGIMYGEVWYVSSIDLIQAAPVSRRLSFWV